MKTPEQILGLTNKETTNGNFMSSDCITPTQAIEAMEIYAEEKCKQLLKDISAVFLDKNNQEKAMLESDKVVFQALGETIVNFPISKHK